MMVFIRPTGAPLGIGATLGFGPNGSSASLDTAPVNAGFAAGDMVLIQSAGALAKVSAASLLAVLVAGLPTSNPGPGQMWLNNGFLVMGN